MWGARTAVVPFPFVPVIRDHVDSLALVEPEARRGRDRESTRPERLELRLVDRDARRADEHLDLAKLVGGVGSGDEAGAAQMRIVRGYGGVALRVIADDGDETGAGQAAREVVRERAGLPADAPDGDGATVKLREAHRTEPISSSGTAWSSLSASSGRGPHPPH